MEMPFLPLIICLAVIPSANTLSSHPKVLLISFDGFRYDLLNASMVPSIYKWATKSSWFVNGVRSQYITYTAPNHMSIVTGMYEQTHGIVSNYFYDTETKEFYDYFNSTQTAGIINASQAAHWYRGEPIWLINDRANPSRRSATFYWPNGETPFPSPPHTPTIYKAWSTYRNLSEWKKDVDDIIELFTREKDPINFISWYIAEPDHTLHGNGFYNGQLKNTLKQLDDLFAYFDMKFESYRLNEEVNVILTADHGHAEIIDISHVMCIRDYVLGNDFQRGDHMIYPKDDQHAREIYRNLTEAIKTGDFKVKVYMKEDLPNRFFYKNSSRVGSIIIEPEVGSAISFSCTKDKLKRTYGSKGNFHFNASTHGMDPNQPEMRAMLTIRGPAIVPSQKIEDIPDNIDLYSLMCYLLEIPPSPHNGSMQVFKKVIRKVDVINQRNTIEILVTDSLGFLAFLLPSMCVVILFLVYGCRHTILKDDPNWTRNQNGYRPLQMDAVAIDKVF